MVQGSVLRFNIMIDSKIKKLNDIVIFSDVILKITLLSRAGVSLAVSLIEIKYQY